MKTVNLTLYKGNKFNLAEVMQNLSIQFAFVNADYKQIHQTGKCRDFLGDIPWSKATGFPVSIYGMKYDFTKNPYDENVFRLSMKFPDRATMDLFIKNFHFMNAKEEFAGVNKATFLYTNEKDTLVVEADPIWYTDTWKVSLYTFYLKCCSYPDPQNPTEETKESGYANILSKYEEVFLNKVKDTSEIFMMEELHDNHNCSGFVSIIQNCFNTNYGSSYRRARKHFGVKK